MCKDWGVMPTEFPDLDPRDRAFMAAQWAEQQRRVDSEGGLTQ